MKASAWIDRVKTAKNLPSDYAAAKELGLSRFTVSGYRKRPDATLDEEISVKIAHSLNISPAVLLADQSMERAKDQEAKSAWLGILEKLGGVAVSIMLTAGMLGGLSWSPDAKASERSQNPSKSNSSIYTSYKVGRRRRHGADPFKQMVSALSRC